MGVRLVWFGTAEGATTDSRGALSLIGFSPQAIAVEAFPVLVAPSLVLVVEDENGIETLGPGHKISISLAVEDSSGETMFLVSFSQELPEKPTPVDLPGRVQVIAPAPFTAAKSGTYFAIAALTVDGTPQLGEERCPFLVLDAESLRRKH